MKACPGPPKPARSSVHKPSKYPVERPSHVWMPQPGGVPGSAQGLATVSCESQAPSHPHGQTSGARSLLGLHCWENKDGGGNRVLSLKATGASCSEECYICVHICMHV